MTVYFSVDRLKMMRVVLSKNQFDKLSDLSIGLGQLFFGSLVVPYLVPSLDRPSLSVLLFGLSLAIGLWIFALRIVRK